MSAAVQSASTTPRTDRAARIRLAWRLAIVLVAAIVVLLALPAWARAPFSIAAALVTVEAFVRRYRGRGLLHAALVAIGGGVVVLSLTGLVLNLLPWGLTAGTWGVAVGLVEAAVLLVVVPSTAGTTAVAGPRRRPSPVAAGWSVLVGLVLAAAVVWSAVSFGTTHVAPLAVAAEPSAGSIVVTVSSGADQGPYELDLVTSSGRTVLRRDVRVGPTASSTTSVRLPADTRGLVQLVPVGSSTAVRELILDSTSATSAAEDTK